MKKKYTIEIHVRRLKQILKAKEPCMYCPASRGFSEWNKPYELWKEKYDDLCIPSYSSCKICQNFVNLKFRPPYNYRACPCHRVGKKRALERTILAIEKYEQTKEKK